MKIFFVNLSFILDDKVHSGKQLFHLMNVDTGFCGDLDVNLLPVGIVEVYLMNPGEMILQVKKLFNAQIGMVFLQKVDSSDQFDKIQRIILKRFNNGNHPLPALGAEQHENCRKNQQDAEDIF